MEMTPDQLVILSNSTDDIQAKAVMKVIGEVQYKQYKEKEQHLTDAEKATFAAVVQAFTAIEAEESGPKPTVH
jgi:hypothetical protein